MPSRPHWQQHAIKSRCSVALSRCLCLNVTSVIHPGQCALTSSSSSSSSSCTRARRGSQATTTAPSTPPSTYATPIPACAWLINTNCLNPCPPGQDMLLHPHLIAPLFTGNSSLFTTDCLFFPAGACQLIRQYCRCSPSLEPVDLS
ncbi:unnamed protein product [Periconia digitata]|uniref:Uncharacterized protein n=1 Tax=Periconia digitata TaxID=1303443 RepID=A0A9W4URP4_9PLEO|nr:unnamed protein product [Periconia digitata]